MTRDMKMTMRMMKVIMNISMYSIRIMNRQSYNEKFHCYYYVMITYDVCYFLFLMTLADTIFMVSKSNSFLKTRDGIETCAKRLAEEVKCFINNKDDKTNNNSNSDSSRNNIINNNGYISFVGHSLGGVIARHAIGILHGEHQDYLNSQRELKLEQSNDYNKNSNRLVGLTPRHFISIASPHAGENNHKSNIVYY